MRFDREAAYDLISITSSHVLKGMRNSFLSIQSCSPILER